MLRDSDTEVSDKNFWLSRLAFWLSFVSHNLHFEPSFFLVKELTLKTNFFFLYIKSVYDNTNEHIHK